MIEDPIAEAIIDGTLPETLEANFRVEVGKIILDLDNGA